MKTGIYSTWLVLGLGLLCPVANGKAMAAKESQPGITVRVINPAGVPAKTLRKAERVAATILDVAGIAITRLECPGLPTLGRHDFWLHVLKDRPPQMHGDVTGFTVLMPERDGAVGYAGVVWPAVEEVAVGLGVSSVRRAGRDGGARNRPHSVGLESPHAVGNHVLPFPEDAHRNGCQGRVAVRPGAGAPHAGDRGDRFLRSKAIASRPQATAFITACSPEIPLPFFVTSRRCSEF